jgi:hypothetical protein
LLLLISALEPLHAESVKLRNAKNVKINAVL